MITLAIDSDENNSSTNRKHQLREYDNRQTRPRLQNKLQRLNVTIETGGLR